VDVEKTEQGGHPAVKKQLVGDESLMHG